MLPQFHLEYQLQMVFVFDSNWGLSVCVTSSSYLIQHVRHAEILKNHDFTFQSQKTTTFRVIFCNSH
jgi:hypothetical protein